MALGGAFVNAVEAMLTQSDALGVISQNVANVNTTAYKSSTDNFATLLSEYNAGAQTNIFGVKAERTQQIDKQGGLATNDQWDSLALNGPGFFVVNNQVDGQGTNYFTRDGILVEKAASTTSATQGTSNGQTTASGSANAAKSTVYLTDQNGDYLMGWQAVNGVTTPTLTFGSLSPVNFQQGSGIAGQGTSNVGIQAILPTNTTQTQAISAGIFDTDGNAQTLVANFTPVGSNQYAVSFTMPATSAAGTAEDPVPPNTLTFDSSGAFQGSSAPVTQVAWNNNTLSNITIDTSKMTASGSGLNISSITQDGIATGTIGTAPTTKITLNGTLPANGPIGASYTTSTTIVDNQYNPHTIDVTFTQTAANTWTVSEALPPPPAPKLTVPTTGQTSTLMQPQPDQALSFDPTSGTMSSTGLYSLPLTYADGTTGSVNVDLSQLLNVPGGPGSDTASFTPINDGQDANGIGGAVPTSNIALTGTLPAGGPGVQTANIQIFDDAGNLYSAELSFTPNGGNSWSVSSTVVPAIQLSASSATAATSTSSAVTTPGAVTDGGVTPINVTWPDGIKSTLSLDLSQLVTLPSTTGIGQYSAVADGQSITTGNGIGSTAISVSGTLPEGSNVNQSINAVVYDDKGNPYSLQLSLSPTGADGWNVNPTLQPIVNFSGSGQPNPPLTEQVNVAWPDGTTSDIKVDLTQLQQSNVGSTEVQHVNQDGFAPGNLTNVEFDSQGDLFGDYTNGQKIKLYQLPVATFVAEDQLKELSGNLYLPTQNSGPASLNSLGILTSDQLAAQSTSNAATSITPNSFEESNVDLGQEFTRMIQSQQAYNSAGQVFKTADDMVQTVRDLIT